MNAILRWAVIGVLLLIYATGVSPELFHRAIERGMLADPEAEGDLYKFSRLAKFRTIRDLHCDPPEDAGAMIPYKSVVVLGDSFIDIQKNDLERFFEERGVAFRYVSYNRSSVWLLEPDAAPSAAVLEIAERGVRGRYNVFETERLRNFQVPTAETGALHGALSRLRLKIFPPDGVSERFDELLSNSTGVRAAIELKAKLTYRLFGRTHPKVIVSRSGETLFFTEEYDRTLVSSSFSPLDDAEVEHLAENINAIYSKLKAKGFSEVFLSIVPNKVSVEDPAAGRYNHLIERLQQTEALVMPSIDAYTPMKAAAGPLYYSGDTHWNCEGRRIWVKALTQALN